MKYTKAQANTLVRQCRYRGQDLENVRRTYMPIAPLARVLNKSPSYVQKICQQLLSKKEPPKPRHSEVRLIGRRWLKSEVISKHKFTAQQVRFLTSD